MGKNKMANNGGWKDEDKVVTTFRTLKQAMQESGDDERNRIVAMLVRMRFESQDSCERRTLSEIIGLLDPDEE
jgi:tellurite resistance protein